MRIISMSFLFDIFIKSIKIGGINTVFTITEEVDVRKR